MNSEINSVKSDDIFQESDRRSSCRMRNRRSRIPVKKRKKLDNTCDGAKTTLSSSFVLKWLNDNYVIESGSCLPRRTLYSHYQDFCKKKSVVPHTAATFGKIVRAKFPNLKTRRLGVRGQSKYHYYGLAVRKSSIYFRNVTVKKGITRFTACLFNNECSTNVCSNKPQLPAFPSLDNVVTHSHPFAYEKLKTFMLMYRAHCERLHDTVTKGNFNEVQNFVLHFWKGMPSHILPILQYQSLCDTLVPDTLQPVCSNYHNDIIQFSKNLEVWLENSATPAINKVKLQAVGQFQRNIKQQLNLMELMKNAKWMMNLEESVDSSLSDLQAIDKSCLFDSIDKIKLKSYKLNSHTVVLEFLNNLEQTLINQSKVEQHFLWIDNMFEVHVEKICSDDKINASHDILLLWNFLITHIEIELITNKAKSQDILSALFKVLTEYIIYIIELLKFHVRRELHLNALKSHTGFDLCVTDDDSMHEDMDTASRQEFTEAEQYDTVVLTDVNLGIFPSENNLERSTSSLSLSYDSSTASSSPISNFIDSPFSCYSPPLFDCFGPVTEYPIMYSPDFGVESSLSEENFTVESLSEDFSDTSSSYSSSCRNMSELLQILESTEKLLSN